jgi:hypothetical protein
VRLNRLLELVAVLQTIAVELRNLVVRVRRRRFRRGSIAVL